MRFFHDHFYVNVAVGWMAHTFATGRCSSCFLFFVVAVVALACSFFGSFAITQWNEKKQHIHLPCVCVCARRNDFKVVALPI